MNINKFTGERYIGIKNGFSLDGVDDYIEFPFNRLENQGSISVHFKMNSFDTPPTANQIFSYLEGGNERVNIAVLNSVTEPKKLFVSFTKGGFVSYISTKDFELDTWYHVVATYSSSEVQVFVNGERVENQTGSFTWTYDTIADLTTTKTRLGVSNGLTFKAEIELGPISIFNRPLLQDEVIYIHRYAGIIPPLTHDDCLFHWTAQYDTIHKGFAQGKNSLAEILIVNQVAHGLLVGQAIRFDGVNWVVADGTVQANWSNPPTVVFLAGVNDFRAFQDGIGSLPTASMGESGDLVYVQANGSITSNRTDNLVGRIIDANQLMIYKERYYYLSTSTEQYNLSKAVGLSEDYGLIYGKNDTDLGVYLNPYATDYSQSYNELKGEPQLTVASRSKVYDGTTMFDVISGFNAINRLVPFSVLFSLNTVGVGVFMSAGDLVNGNNSFAIYRRTNVTGFPRLCLTFQLMKVGVVNSMGMESANELLDGEHLIIITYDGSGDANGVEMYVDGNQEPITIYANLLANDLVYSYSLLCAYWSIFTSSDTPAFNGSMKRVEILNRVATPSEIALASERDSFLAAGITYDSGDYFLAIDFDKKNGDSPTTFPATPSYTITSVGNEVYEGSELESNYPHIKEGLKLTSTLAGYPANTYINLNKSNLPNENTDDYTFVWQGYVNLKDFNSLGASAYVREHLFLLTTLNTGVWNTSNRLQFTIQYENFPVTAYPLPALFLGRAGVGGFSDSIIDAIDVRGVFTAPLTLVTTYNSATNTWSYYMNGVLRGTGNVSTKVDFNNPSTVFRLNNTLAGSGNSQFFSGHEIFGFGYWKRELHITEILHLHNNGLWNNPWTQLPVYHKRYMKDGLIQWLNFSEANIYDDAGTLKIVNQADVSGLTDAVLIGYPNLATAHNAVYYKQELQ